MADFASLIVQLELQQAAFTKGMNDAAKKLDQVANSAKKTQSSLTGLQQGFQAVKVAAAAIGTAMAAVRGGEAIIRAADNLKMLQASFKALTGDATRGTDLLARVVEVADRTGAPLESTGAAMQRLTIAMKELGGTNAQVANLTETFLMLGTIGGTSTEDAARALTQLSQGLAAGALQGEELKAILEGMPLVAQAIAKELGVTIGQLKKMGSEGQISAQQVANALLKMTDQVRKEFGTMPVTLDQALNRLETRWTLFLASFDQASNLGNNVRDVINFIADGIKRWTEELDGANGKMSTIGAVAKTLDISFRVIAGAVAAMNFQLELTVRATATLIMLAADVATGFKNAGAIMADFGKQTAKSTADLIAFEKKMAGMRDAAAAAAGGAADTFKGGGGKGGGKGGAAASAAKEAEALQKRADAIAASVNPLHAYNQALAEYTMLLEKGFLSDRNFALAKEKATEALNAAGDAVRAATDPLFVYNQELEKLQRLYDNAAISAETLAAAQQKAKEKLDEVTGKKQEKTFMEQMEDLAESAGKAMGDFLGDLVTGSATAEEAFKKMASTILSKIAEMVAAAAAAFIIKSLFGGGGGDIAGGSGTIMSAPVAAMSAASSALMSSAAATDAAVSSFARGPAAPTLTATDAMTSATAGTASARPEFNVVVNNNAGDAVSTRMNESGDLEITIDRVRRALSRDMSRGGNVFSDTMERSFGLNRMGAT